MKPVRYYAFFSQAKYADYKSTREVVDFVLKYEALANYRMTLSSNDNYWFMANALDLVQQQYGFYKKLYKDGKDLPVAGLRAMLDEFKQAINNNYPTPDAVNKSIIVRDTLKLLDIWLNALLKILLEQLSEANKAAMDKVSRAWNSALDES